MKETLNKLILNALEAVDAGGVSFVVEHPTNLAFGDYSTNAGIVSKKAPELLAWLEKNKPKEVEGVELKSGFINFYLSKDFFAESLKQIIKEGEKFGKGKKLKGEKVMVEYTDANLFKEFHIGHLMSNTIGESIARLREWSGASVRRANYQGDVGLHVAKTIWAMLAKEGGPFDITDIGRMYKDGSSAYEISEDIKKIIEDINKKIYDGSDSKINSLYNQGRKLSLEYFEGIYKKLGMNPRKHFGDQRYFDYYFYESASWHIGKEIVDRNTPGVFQKSNGATVFHGENYNSKLHTRVFITSQGLPTYEAKELGLLKSKVNKWGWNFNKSISITANEQTEYFKVVLEAARNIPELVEAASRTNHLAHGILRLTTGKMSSRTGEIITAKTLIEEVKGRVKGDEQVAIGAIKYMILRSNIGGDIVFDIDKSVSTEGDSGVYLQYAHARASSLLEKADKKGSVKGERSEVHEVEKILYRFPEIIERAQADYAPHYITTYLTELASAFNNFYAHSQVIGNSPEASYRLAIVEAVKIVLKNGLTILGIPAPERM